MRYFKGYETDRAAPWARGVIQKVEKREVSKVREAPLNERTLAAYRAGIDGIIQARFHNKAAAEARLAEVEGAATALAAMNADVEKAVAEERGQRRAEAEEHARKEYDEKLAIAAEEKRTDDERRKRECMREAANGCLLYAAGLRGRTDVTEGRAFLESACAKGIGSACGVAANMYIRGDYDHDEGKATALLKKGCKLGDQQSCDDDMSCPQQREVAITGYRATPTQLNVDRTKNVVTIGACDQYCNDGVAGACFTAAAYRASSGKTDAARTGFKRACTLGSQKACSRAGDL